MKTNKSDRLKTPVFIGYALSLDNMGEQIKALHTIQSLLFGRNNDWAGFANYWDNGKEGNYWSDYLSKYPNATELDHSGIGEPPYAIIDNTTYSDNYANGTTKTGTAVLGTAIDRYPAMLPFSALIGPNHKPTDSPSPTHHNMAHESFPSFAVATVSVLAAVFVVSGLLIYFKKYKPKLN